jgi:hypothetical protein
MPAEGNDAYLNVANSAVDSGSARVDLPRILTIGCALHHISEKCDAVIIRTDETSRTQAAIDVPPKSPLPPVSAAQFDLNWLHRWQTERTASRRRRDRARKRTRKTTKTMPCRSQWLS